MNEAVVMLEVTDSTCEETFLLGAMTVMDMLLHRSEALWFKLANKMEFPQYSYVILEMLCHMNLINKEEVHEVIDSNKINATPPAADFKEKIQKNGKNILAELLSYFEANRARLDACIKLLPKTELYVNSQATNEIKIRGCWSSHPGDNILLCEAKKQKINIRNTHIYDVCVNSKAKTEFDWKKVVPSSVWRDRAIGIIASIRAGAYATALPLGKALLLEYREGVDDSVVKRALETLIRSPEKMLYEEVSHWINVPVVNSLDYRQVQINPFQHLALIEGEFLRHGLADTCSSNYYHERTAQLYSVHKSLLKLRQTVAGSICKIILIELMTPKVIHDLITKQGEDFDTYLNEYSQVGAFSETIKHMDNEISFLTGIRATTAIGAAQSGLAAMRLTNQLPTMTEDDKLLRAAITQQVSINLALGSSTLGEYAVAAANSDKINTDPSVTIKDLRMHIIQSMMCEEKGQTGIATHATEPLVAAMMNHLSAVCNDFFSGLNKPCV